MQVPMDQRSDEELLLGSLKGRSGDFKLLLERYEGELFNFLYRCTGDRQVSEDLFQETFLQVYAKMDIFRPEGRFRPWVYTIAANLARDAMRKHRRRRALSLDAEIRSGEDAKLGDFIEDGTPAPEDLLDREESISLARDLLDDLPEALREVVTLYFFNDMKYIEISEVLGLPLGTVKSRLFRAVRQMAAALRQKRGF
ncbi:MAG: RNA polymerase sigma factor [Planctomycetota bacterium]